MQILCKWMVICLIAITSGSCVSTDGSILLLTKDQVNLHQQPIVKLPTNRREILEYLFYRACVQQTVFTKYEKIQVFWPDDLKVAGNLTVRIMTATGRIYLEHWAFVQQGTALDLSYAYQLPEGNYQIVFMPTPNEYYLDRLRIKREIEIQIRPRQVVPIQTREPCQ